MKRDTLLQLDQQLGLSSHIWGLFEIPLTLFNRVTNDEVIHYCNEILQDEAKKLGIPNCRKVHAYYNRSGYRLVDEQYDILINYRISSKIEGRNTLRNELKHIEDEINNRQPYDLVAHTYELKELLKDLIPFLRKRIL